MGEADNLIREKLREWQTRRLEIKDQIQLHPERTLELSGLLDLMDEEHAQILSGSSGSQTEAAFQQNSRSIQSAFPEYPMHPVTDKYDLQLHVVAHSIEDLRKLLEMAIHELQGQIDTKGALIMGKYRKYPGSMSGTLGNYHFELAVYGEDSHE